MKNNFCLISFYYNWNGDTDFSWCNTLQYPLADVTHYSTLCYLKNPLGGSWLFYLMILSTALIIPWQWWVDMRGWSIGGITVTGGTNVLVESCPSATLYNTKATRTAMEMKPEYWRWNVTCGQMDSNKQFGTSCNFLLWTHLKTTRTHSFNPKGYPLLIT
jgi:hypothetical protein